MASSRQALNGPDLQDCVEAWKAFEEQNQVRVVMTLRSTNAPESRDLWLEGKCLSMSTAGVVPVLLVSAQLTNLLTRHKTMAAAVFGLLYALDFQLAESEWASANKGHEVPPAHPSETG